MLKRNYAYNKGDIEYSVSGVRLTCKVAGTTSTEDLVIPPNVNEVTDGTVVWSLIDISRGGAVTNYSTEEQRIGTWIDGKSLYQKTYSIFSHSGMFYTVDTNLNSLNYKVIDLRGYGHDANNNYSFPYADVSYTVGCYLNNTTGVLYTRALSGGEVNTNFHPDYVTIKYTKITD